MGIFPDIVPLFRSPGDLAISSSDFWRLVSASKNSAPRGEETAIHSAGAPPQVKDLFTRPRAVRDAAMSGVLSADACGTRGDIEGRCRPSIGTIEIWFSWLRALDDKSGNQSLIRIGTVLILHD